MHVCTVVLGKTASMAAGNPFSPSQQAMSTSRTPRDCSSPSTRIQNFAPSLSSAHSPSTCLQPSLFIPMAT